MLDSVIKDDDFDPELLSWNHPALREIDALDRRIEQHAGSLLANRVDQFNRVFEAWAGFSIALHELLMTCETDDEVKAELWRNVGDRTQRKWIVRSLDQATIAYTAGLGAVIDQSRTLVKTQNQSIQLECAERSSNLLTQHPGGHFLAKLRNYVLHYVAAPWIFSGTFGEDATARVGLESATLLDGNKSWSSDAKKFIDGSGESVHLSPIISSYFDAMVEHHEWLMSTITGANTKLFKGCDELIKERNLLLSGEITDGHDWEDRVVHMGENIRRSNRGETQTDYRAGLTIIRDHSQ